MFQDLKNHVKEHIQNKEAMGVSPSVEELKSLIGVAMIKEWNSGVEVYEDYSPREITQIFHSPFESNCPVQLNKLSSEEYTMIPIFRQVKRLLEVIEEKKELELTAKGNLPVKIVKELYTLGVPDDNIETGYFKLAKEQDSNTVRIVRILAQSASLIKIRKGALFLTVEGIHNFKDDALLLKTLFVTFCSKIDWKIFDIFSAYCDINKFEFAFSIVMLGRYGAERRIDNFYAEKNYKAFPIFSYYLVPDYIPSNYTYYYTRRIIKGFMSYFGLIELEKGLKRINPCYLKKSAIFDKLFRIIPPKQ